MMARAFSGGTHTLMDPSDMAAAPSPLPRSFRWRLAGLVLLLGFSLLTFSPLIADPDLWGHLRFGQDLLKTGKIIRPDVYSYLTAGPGSIMSGWRRPSMPGFTRFTDRPV